MLFDFIRRWRFNRQRAVFRYWDGRRTCYADPAVVHRVLYQKGGDGWPALLVAAGGLKDWPADADPGAVAAERRAAGREVTRLAREAFDVAPLGAVKGRPVGLTDAEVARLLVSFLDFCKALGERGE